MSSRNLKLLFSFFMILALGVVPMFGASAVIGSVAGSTNATVGGQDLMPNTTVFSGDTLRVNDGAAVVAMGMGSRMVFGRETVASFDRKSDEVTVSLDQGNVSMYQPEDGVAMRVKIGQVSVLAAKGYKTVGDVAMVNGAIVVSAKEGMLRVEGPERSVEVTQGKTIAVVQQKQPAGSPQPQAAASHMSQTQVLGVVSLGVTAANTVLAVVNVHKTNQVKDQVTQTDTDAKAAIAAANAATAAANTADADAKAARAAANAAGAVAAIACQTVSPTSTTCAFTPK